MFLKKICTEYPKVVVVLLTKEKKKKTPRILYYFMTISKKTDFVYPS